MRTFDFELMSPDNRVALSDVVSVDFATPEGRIQILGGHEAMVAELTRPEIRVKTASGIWFFVANGAFAHVSGTRTTIVADGFVRDQKQ